MIGPIENQQPIRPERTKPEPGVSPEKAAPQTRPADRVEISAEARERATRLDGVTGLSPERMAEIRQRLSDGTYSTPEVLETVARRMIEQGDV